MNETEYTGGCLCGAVRYRVTGRANNLCYCHCQSCRRAAGAPMVAWGTFVRGRFVVTQGSIVEYRSSPDVTRGFCGRCGTAITYCHAKRPAEIDVTLVTLDDPAAFAPEAHIWVQDKLPWIEVNDGRPAFEQVRFDDS